MGAALGDPAALDDEDLVGAADGRQAVGDDEGGAAGHRLGERLLDRGLVRRIERRGRLVEDDHRGSGEQQPGDGEALALAAGQPVTALADHGVEAVGQVRDDVVEPGAVDRVAELGLGRVRLREDEVVADRLVEQVPVLCHHAHGPLERLEAQLAHVRPADRHRAAGDVVEAGEQRGDRRLARARAADESHGGSRCDLEVDAVEHLGAGAAVERGDVLEARERHLGGGRVREAHVAVGDGDRAGGERLRVLRLGEQRLEVEHLEHPLEAHDRAHDVHPGVGEHGERGVQAGEEHRERDDLPGVEVAEHRLHTAEAVDEGEREGGHEGERSDEGRLEHRRPHPDVAHAARAVGELAGFRGRPAEQLDEGGAAGGEPLGHARGHRGIVVRGLVLEEREAPAEHPGGNEEDRQQEDRQCGDLPGDRHHDADGEDEGDDVRHDPGERVGEGALGADDVGVEAGHERTRAGAVEERDRQRLHVVEHRGAEVEDQALTHPGGQIAVDEAEAGVEDREARHRECDPDDDGDRAAAGDGVDDVAGEDRGDDADDGDEDGHGDEAGELGAVAPGEAVDAAHGGPGDLSGALGRGRVGADRAAHDHVRRGHAHTSLLEVTGRGVVPGVRCAPLAVDRGAGRLSGLSAAPLISTPAGPDMFPRVRGPGLRACAGGCGGSRGRRPCA